MYTCWTDTDRRRSAVEKLAAAADCYRAKFGREPTTALVSPVDAERIAEGWPVLIGDRVLEIQARSFVPSGCFLVGEPDKHG